DWPSGKKITRVDYSVTKIDLGQPMLDRIVRRQQFISDYYSADIQIKLAEEDLKKIDLNNPDNNEQYQDFSRRVLKIVDQIKGKKLAENLYLNENDPLNLMPRLNALQNNAIDTKRKLVKQVADLHIEYYRLGLASLNANDRSKATEYFQNAIEIDPKFSAPYVRLAEIEMKQANTKKCLEWLVKANNTNNHPDSVKLMAQKVVDELIRPKLDDIKLFRAQKNLTDREQLLNECLSIFDTIPMISIPPVLITERNAFYSDWLEKKISDNHQIIRNKEYSRYLDDCDSLYRFHNQFINYFNNRTRVEQHLSQIYGELLSKAESIITANPMEALDILVLSENLCQKYSFINCNPRSKELIAGVFGKLYEDMIDEAYQLFNAEKIRQADSLQQKAFNYSKQQNVPISSKHLTLIRLLRERTYLDIFLNIEQNKYKGCQAKEMADSAILLRNTFNFSPITKEKALTLKAAELCVVQLINSADKNIVAKRLTEAEINLSKISDIQRSYGLTLSNEHEARVAELKGMLMQNRCLEQKFSIDVQINAAEIHQKERNYIAAEIALNKALELVKKGAAECGFKGDDLQQKFAFVQKPATYQKEIDEIIENIQRHQFEKAISQYEKVTEQFSDSLLRMFGLTLLPMEQFAKTYDYTPFTLACIEHFAIHGKTETSLELLYFLYEKEIPEFLTDKAQDALGRSLAKRDVAKNKEANPTELVYGYTRHDPKWFKKLIKSYKSQWKKSIDS
ncbi:MAG TPA: hypothetical protein PK990_04380, partial [Salinivirgaceae bacterium]|nr:hypothetical protein [Salinivirgaceae bacterium]